MRKILWSGLFSVLFSANLARGLETLKPGLLYLPSADASSALIEREKEIFQEQGYWVQVVDYYEDQVSKPRWDQMDSNFKIRQIEKSFAKLNANQSLDRSRLGAIASRESTALVLQSLKGNSKMNLRALVLRDVTPTLDRSLWAGLTPKLFLIISEKSQPDKEIIELEKIFKQLALSYEIQRIPASFGFYDFSNSKSFDSKLSEKSRAGLIQFLNRFVSLKEPIKYDFAR